MLPVFTSFSFASFLFFNSVSGAFDEQRLYKDLMKNYNKLERPSEQYDLPVEVKLGVVLNQIIDVVIFVQLEHFTVSFKAKFKQVFTLKDEKNQVIQINIWLNYEWYDYNLRWEPQEYGGVEDLRFPADKLWRPDILLYNSVDPVFDTTFATNFVVYSSGTVSWIPPSIVKTSCKINIRYFPFDDQTCHLKFGSWTYSGKKLNLLPNRNETDMSEYMPNGEWLLLGAPVVREVQVNQKNPEDSHPTLHFYFHIRRRTLYYGFNLIIPGLIISVMTILGFTLPPDAGEKITLEITILLSICLYMNIVSNMSPPTSEAIPLLAIFFILCMTVVSASVVFTVVVINFHYRTQDTHKMSVVTRAFLLNWLPWILRMQRPGRTFFGSSLVDAFKEQRRRDGDHTLLKSSSSSRLDFELGYTNMNLNMDYEAHIQRCLKLIQQRKSYADAGLNALLLSVQRIYTELKFITQRMERDEEEMLAKNDWKFAAMVVDRLCLFIFTSVICISTMYIMLTAPYIVA